MDLGLFQREAAAIIGVDVTTLRLWEWNRTRPASEILFKWRFEADSTEYPLPAVTDSAMGKSSWSGRAVIGGRVTVNAIWRSQADTALTTFGVAPRQWTIPVSYTGLEQLNKGSEPVTGMTVVYGANVSGADSLNQSYAPDGVNGYTFAAVEPGGPNAGYAYVAAHAYTLDRTIWVNQWIKSAWSFTDMRDPSTGLLYNRCDAENVIFSGNAQKMLDDVRVHELTGPVSHQQRFSYSVSLGLVLSPKSGPPDLTF